MRPMVSTATIILARESEDPFWNSSQTNFPRPGFCASISAAISTIQPTPSDRRRPVKINGREDGKISLTILLYQESCMTRPTFVRSLSIEETPYAVLINVGHSEHSVTVIADTRKDFSNNPSLVTCTAETTIVTRGSQARGETGLNIWISGLKAALTNSDMPHRIPSGTATSVAIRKPIATVCRLVTIWSR